MRRLGQGLLGLMVGTSLVLGMTGCSSTRQIDVNKSGSWPIEGTTWYGFCDGRNAFIWIPSKTDTDPDELEAVIYDHARCVGSVAPSPSSSSRPDTDPDGVVDDDD